MTGTCVTFSSAGSEVFVLARALVVALLPFAEHFVHLATEVPRGRCRALLDESAIDRPVLEVALPGVLGLLIDLAARRGPSLTRVLTFRGKVRPIQSEANTPGCLAALDAVEIAAPRELRSEEALGRQTPGRERVVRVAHSGLGVGSQLAVAREICMRAAGLLAARTHRPRT